MDASEWLRAQRGAPGGGVAPRLQPTVLEEAWRADVPPPAAPDLRAAEALGEELDGLHLSGDLDAVLADVAKEVAKSPEHWEVRCSQQFRKCWRQRDAAVQEIALQLVLMLVCGRDERFHVNHAKRLEHAEDGLGLFESYMGKRGRGKAYRLIWEEVWDWSERYGCWRDSIVLWGVSHHDKVTGLVSFISRRFRERQNAWAASRPKPPERRPVVGGVRLPRELQGDPPARKYAVGLCDTLELGTLVAAERGCAANVEAGASGALAKDDLPTLSTVREQAKQLAEAELAGRAASCAESYTDPKLRARVADSIKRELDIVCARGPVVVIGRSGTGKTACAVARLWSLHHAYISSLNEGRALFRSGHYRCVYITTNEVLLRNVRRDFSSLEPDHMLLAPSREREEAEEAPWAGGSAGLLGSGDADLMGIPSVASVGSEMYPLFLTGRKWLRLLDGTLRDRFFTDARGPDSEVKYDAFHAKFWATLSKAERAKLPHPRLVWTEFMSLISGSAESLGTPEGSVELKKYLAMGAERSRLADDPQQRKSVWELYGAYRKWKGKNRYDIADVPHHIYGVIKKDGYFGPPLHEIIVDEVQDFTGAELGLIAFVIADRSGLIFCGDTCQTVARGLAFRICDLQSIFFHLFRTKQELSTMKLHLNYRSHDGILSFAAVCVKLLEKLFPNEIDELPPDQGLSLGPKPCLLLASEHTGLASFLFGSATGPTELGPDQVIIIREVGKRRDEERKQLLQKLFGDSIWLTVAEAKGLEFDEVLLFDFFADGPRPKDEGAGEARSEEQRRRSAAERAEMWQDAVLEGGPAVTQSLTDCAKGKGKGKYFDRYANRLVATELKELYTSVTRAKSSLWIFEEDESARKAMFGLFERAEVVEVIPKQGGRTGEALPGSSGTPEQWARRGMALLEQGLFAPAAVAFRKAGDKYTHMATLAEAEHELAMAEREPEGPAMRQRYLAAAKLFVQIERRNKAADCYLRAGERELARAAGGLGWCVAQARTEMESTSDPSELATLAGELAEDFARASSEEQTRHEEDCKATRAQLLSRAAAVGLERSSSAFDMARVEACARAAVELFKGIERIYGVYADAKQTFYTLCRLLERNGRHEEALFCADEAAGLLPNDCEITTLQASLFLAIANSERAPLGKEQKQALLERAADLYKRMGRSSDAADCYLRHGVLRRLLTLTGRAGNRKLARATGGLQWCISQARGVLESSGDPSELATLADVLADDFAKASSEEQIRHEEVCKATRAALLNRAASIGLKQPSDAFDTARVEVCARAAIDLFVRIDKALARSAGFHEAYCTLCLLLRNDGRYEGDLTFAYEALKRFPGHKDIIALCTSSCSIVKEGLEAIAGERKQALLERAAQIYKRLGMARGAADCYLRAGKRELARAAGGLGWCVAQAHTEMNSTSDPSELATLAAELADNFAKASSKEQTRHEEGCKATRAQLLSRAAAVGLGLKRPSSAFDMARVEACARAAVELFKGIDLAYARSADAKQAFIIHCRALERLGRSDEALICAEQAAKALPDDTEIIKLQERVRYGARRGVRAGRR